jgi:preprotein translocase SecE subunit
MAEDMKAKKGLRKVESMRDKSAKGETAGTKSRRLKGAVKQSARPFKAASRVAKKEYFIVQPRQTGTKSFLTRSRRWTPGYFRSAYGELKQVTWPSRKESWKLVSAVFIFSIAFGLVITIVDYGLEKLFRKAFL